MRIVSLCPSNSEILFALGAGGDVVAVEKWTDYPPEATQLPSVGTEMDVDMDLVASHKPDLVLASLSVPGMERNVEALKESGFPHLVLNPESLEDVFTDILTVGDAVGRSDKAIELVKEMKEEIRISSAINIDRERPARVYIEWWAEPAITPGSRCWTRGMIEAAGGRNVFDALNVRSQPVPYEEVVKHDPELVILCWCGMKIQEIDPQTAFNREGWDRIHAVRSGRVYPVEEGWYGRPGPRLVKGVQQIAEWISFIP